MTDYEQFKRLRTWNCVFDDIIRHPENLKLLLVSSDERKRLAACEFVKEVLEEKFEEEKSQGNLKEYEVSVIDISSKKRDFPFEYNSIFERSGIHDGRLFVPIYHNADNHLDLPQIIFDKCNKPGILSYTPDAYWNIINYSKRGCYIRLNV